MYAGLSDEDKLELAIRFIAVEQPLPLPLVDFLKEHRLYELVVQPGGNHGSIPSEHATNQSAVL